MVQEHLVELVRMVNVVVIGLDLFQDTMVLSLETLLVLMEKLVPLMELVKMEYVLELGLELSLVKMEI